MLSQINPIDLEQELMDLVTRLAENDYSPQKQSAINLIPVLYKYVSKESKKILLEYKRIIKNLFDFSVCGYFIQI